MRPRWPPARSTAGGRERASRGQEIARNSASFEREQRALALESPRIARQRATTPDDAMARNEDAQRIAAGRSAHGAHAAGRADLGRDVEIRRGRAATNACDGCPDLLLECGACGREWQIRVDLTAGKIGGQRR